MKKASNNALFVGFSIVFLAVATYVVANEINNYILVSSLLKFNERLDKSSENYQFSMEELNKQKHVTAHEIGQKVSVDIIDGKHLLNYTRKCKHNDPLWVYEKDNDAWVLCSICEELNGYTKSACRDMLRTRDFMEALKAEFHRIEQERGAFLGKYFNETVEDGKDVWQAKTLWEILVTSKDS